MTLLFSAGCFFLLCAIFGVQLAKFALKAETSKKGEVPGTEPNKNPVLRVLDWHRHSDGTYSVVLDDDTSWQGQNRWWWSSTTHFNVPCSHIVFLEGFYIQAEAAFQKDHPPPQPRSNPLTTLSTPNAQ